MIPDGVHEQKQGQAQNRGSEQEFLSVNSIASMGVSS